MAIQIDELTLPWTASEARWYLQTETDSFGCFFDVDRCYELSAILQREIHGIVKECRSILANPNFKINDKASRIAALLNVGVNVEHFEKKGKGDGAMSLDAKTYERIRQDTTITEEARKLVELFSTYTSDTRNIGFLEGIATLPRSQGLDVHNHRMSIGHPQWTILSTSRFSARDPGVQGIPRSMSDILTEPKGFHLYRADSSQIEPKINFSFFTKDDLIANLITYYKDAYKGILVFCELSSANEQIYRQDFSMFQPPEVDEKEFADNRQVIKRLTNAGSYGSGNLTDIHPRLGKLYEMKIVNHPSRLAQVRKVTQDVNRGVDTFYGAFGTPVTPDETEKYKKGSSTWHDHVVRCGINNPVQTTASELMLHSIYHAREAIDHSKNSHIAFYKHDEGVFYLSDEDMTNGTLDALREITAYSVKGWIPIECDGLEGIKHGDYPSYL